MAYVISCPRPALLSAPSVLRKLPQRARKVSWCAGLVVEGIGARGGHRVSLQARPPCGERGQRLRLIQRLFKYHKWPAATSKIATRPVRVLLPDIVGDGRVESGSGLLLVALCATPSGGRLFCPSMWPLNGHDGVVFGTRD